METENPRLVPLHRFRNATSGATSEADTRDSEAVDAERIDHYIDDRPQEGVFRVHRDVFRAAELFELEQKFIFERTWSFVGLDSQLRRPNDFITTHIGRVPVLVMRDAQGALAAFVNTCRHKGALLCRTESGNARVLVCNYHGWAYESTGKNIGIKDREAGCYRDAFNAESHDLIALPRLESYKGLLFASLHPDVPSLADFLGGMRPLIDLAMEQGPEGMEFLPGRIIYTYDANWKLQMDNGIDFYHLTSTHPSFMEVVRRREEAEQGNLAAKQFDWNRRMTQRGGMFGFEYGHSAIWLTQAQPEKRPIHATREEVGARMGPAVLDWMFRMRNTTLFPNMQIADSTSLMIRTFRPLSPQKTEMRVYCMAPIGEAADVRAWRLRQFEDFFNVSGFATPDDTVVYEDCQSGFYTGGDDWLQGYQRGMGIETQGANDAARELGVIPVSSLEAGFKVQNETCFQASYREWARLLRAGLTGQPAYGRLDP